MKNSTTGHLPQPASGETEINGSVSLSGKRLWLIRVIAYVLVPVIFFAGLELSLRIVGFGYPTSYFVPSQIKGEDFLIPNGYFSYRFFPPALARRPFELRMAAQKPAGTYRIFLFGESAAYGDPNPAYGVGRYLEVLLQERFPGNDFEIVNTGMTAINSHAILPIAREVAQLDSSDLWIIYMGNNEMIGAFGPGTVFSSKAPSLAMARVILAVKSTRTGQLMASIVSGLQKDDKAPKKWDGINMFSKNLSYADPGRLIAYDNFRGNLQDILDAAIGAQVPVLLSTVGSNLKHTAPFNSMHSENLDDAQISEWTSHYSQGVALENEGYCAEALEHYLLAETIDSLYAELQFRMGGCYLQVGNLERALVAYTQARDYDGLAVRADTRINQIIRDTAAQHTLEKVKLVDAVQLLRANSPDGIPGQDLFYEHVHYALDGNYRLARVLAEEVAMKLPSHIASSDQGGWVDAKVSANQLAVTIWDHYQVWTEVVKRISVPPHKGTLNYKVNLDYAKAQKKAVISQIDLNETPKQDRALYLRALSKNPDDNYLHMHFAQYLQGNGELFAGIDELKVVSALLPDLEWPHYFLGGFLGAAKKYDEAAQSFRRALEIRSDFTLAQEGLDRIEKLQRQR
jgi:tetratricopeptide (TPR) repeat protein